MEQLLSDDKSLELNEVAVQDIDDKESLLLTQLALVGAEVLMEMFSFSTGQATRWLNETLNQIEEKYAIHAKKPTNIL